MVTVQVLETVGFILLFIAVVSAWPERFRLLQVSKGAFAMVSGFMILLGTIVFGTDSKAEAYDILINNEKIEDYKFQAGFYLSIAAGFLSVVTGIVFCAFRIDKQVPGQRQSHAASGPRTLDSIKHIFKERRSRLSNLICRQDITICLWFDNEWNKNSGDKLPIAS